MLARVGSIALTLTAIARPLEYMFQYIKTSQIPLNAQDVYQVCVTALHSDTLGMMQDPDFMRSISTAFQRSNQTVLTPFQVNLVLDVLSRAGVNITANELTVPEEEPSPEALLNILKSMNANKQRDETKLEQVMSSMRKLIDDFTPSLLADVVVELGRLRCFDTAFLGDFAKRACKVSDDLSPLHLGGMVKSLFFCAGVPHMVLMRVLNIIEQRCSEFQPEDYINTLQGLHAAGPRYARTFRVLVKSAMDKVEGMDAATLVNFLVCFSSLGYQNRQHMEIFVDALIEVIEDLSEKDTTQAMVAMVQLRLLTDESWDILASHIMSYVPTLDVKNQPPIMDMCSQVPFETTELMAGLLDRAADCVRLFTPAQMGEILDIIALYPPAREHHIVQLFGKQARLRLDLLGPTPLTGVCRGLANLGYSDATFYTEACQCFFRYGFKDFSHLEPILQGLCIESNVGISTVKILGSYLISMASLMSLMDIERANRYMIRLECDDEMVYKALADRVRVFVRDVTPDMPEDLQVLLARGAAAEMTMVI